MSSETTYHIRIQGKVTGPYTLAYLKGQRDQRRLAKFHELSIDNGVTWAPASSFEEVFPKPTAPVKPVRRPEPGENPEKLQEPEPAAAKTKWFYLDAQGVQQGPVLRGELLNMLEGKALPWTTMVWQAEMKDWAAATSLPEFAFAQSATAADPPIQSTLAVIALISSLLWVFCLGSFIGIVVGIFALREIYRSKGAVVGIRMAWTAIILGVAGVLLTFVVGPVGYWLYFKYYK